MTSINTNTGALVALRNLSSTSYSLDVTQNRVSTGLRVTSPKEDASNFSIAQGLRADLKAFDAVQQGLSSGRGIVTAAIAGATSVSAYVTHGVLSGGAVARVTSSPLQSLVITDSIQATEAVRVSRNVRQLTVAPLLGEAIRRISEESSVSSLFN